MRKYQAIFLGLLLLINTSNFSSCRFDNPISVGLTSSLLLPNNLHVALMCAVHCYLKDNKNLPAPEGALGYLLGWALGRAIRPELKAIYKEVKEMVIGRSKIKKLTPGTHK